MVATRQLLPPAQLLIGSSEDLTKHVINYLQNQVCVTPDCHYCKQCQLIEQKQHPSVLWTTTEKNYTLEMLEPVKNVLTYAQDDNTQFFIVLEHAHLLSITCANSLLKVLEEPPRGYYFILLSPSLDALLPTIQSRCFIQHITGEKRNQLFHHDLFYAFTANRQNSVFEFLALLEKDVPDEITSNTIIQQILAYWLENYKIGVLNSNREQQKKAFLAISTFQKAREKPLMPGSSKLFWKNIFLHYNN